MVVVVVVVVGAVVDGSAVVVLFWTGSRREGCRFGRRLGSLTRPGSSRYQLCWRLPGIANFAKGLLFCRWACARDYILKLKRRNVKQLTPAATARQTTAKRKKIGKNFIFHLGNSEGYESNDEMGRHLCARRQFSYPKRQTTPKNMMRSTLCICVSLLLVDQHDKLRADSQLAFVVEQGKKIHKCVGLSQLFFFYRNFYIVGRKMTHASVFRSGN